MVDDRMDKQGVIVMANAFFWLLERITNVIDWFYIRIMRLRGKDE